LQIPDCRRQMASRADGELGRASAKMTVGMGRAMGEEAVEMTGEMGRERTVEENRMMLGQTVAVMNGVEVGEVTG
jgi:hypothetical protein